MVEFGEQQEMTEQLDYLAYVYLCPLCDSVTATWKELIAHFDEHHSTDCRHSFVGTTEVRVVRK